MMQTSSIRLEDHGDSGSIACPNCGHTATHHDRVEIFYRAEDAPTGMHVVQEAGRVAIDDRFDDNPSERRGGVSIRFWCEGCHVRFTLCIAQHKGASQTFVSYDPDVRIQFPDECVPE